MPRSSTAWGILLLVFEACCGCGMPRQARPVNQYFTLEYACPQFKDMQPLSAVLRVDGFKASPDCNTRKMIYRDDKFARNAYPYQRWRANPADLVSYFLARDMNESGLFRAALSYDANVVANYGISGVVQEFYENDIQDYWSAVLVVSVTLFLENEPDISRQILFQRVYRQSRPATQKTPQAIAAAMSRAMAEVSRQIISDVHDKIAAHEAREKIQ